MVLGGLIGRDEFNVAVNPWMDVEVSVVSM